MTTPTETLLATRLIKADPSLSWTEAVERARAGKAVGLVQGSLATPAADGLEKPATGHGSTNEKGLE